MESTVDNNDNNNNNDNADPDVGGPPPTRTSIRKNLVPLCLGVVMGFASFGIVFGFQVMTMDDLVYTRHNETLQALKDLLITTLKEKEVCLDLDDTRALEVSALQSQLAGHEGLGNKYATLRQEFESMTKTLETVQVEKEEALREQREIIESLSTEKADILQEWNQLREDQTRLLEENQILREQIDEADAILSDLRTRADETESILDAIELRMQRRENFLCRDE